MRERKAAAAGESGHPARVHDRGGRTAEEAAHALPRVHHRAGGELGVRLQLQPLDRALGERAALQQLVLRLVVVHPALHELDELLVREDVRACRGR